MCKRFIKKKTLINSKEIIHPFGRHFLEKILIDIEDIEKCRENIHKFSSESNSSILKK